MNDEFLHALRRDPRPEFARELKRRLQRQPEARSNRFWTVRTVLAVLLVGGFAMAAALLMRGGDEPAREARPVALSAPSSPQRAPQPPVAPQPERRVARNDSAPSRPQAPEHEPETVDLRGTFATSFLARPIAQSLVDGLRGFDASKPRVVVMDDDVALAGLCTKADFAMVSRRINQVELAHCASERIDVAEWLLGYQAVVLTAGPTAESAALTPREVFLALARQVPDPADPSQVIDNPNMTWRDVDARFDYRRIDVFMPADATTRALFARLIMEPGCETYPWIRKLKVTDRRRFDDICHQLRSDERLHEVELSGTLVTQRLWAEPNFLVVLDYSFYSRFRAEVLGTMLAGPVPTLATLSDGTYLAARPVYVYANRHGLVTKEANRWLTYALTDGFTVGARQGLVRPDDVSRRQQADPWSLPAALRSLKPQEPSR